MQTTWNPCPPLDLIQKKKPNIVHLVSLPIGNDRDLSFRAKEILESCDLLIGEESKFLSSFLKRIGINKKFILYNEHCTEQELNEIIQKIGNVENTVIVSDAGLPTLEDPGRSIVPRLYSSGFKLSFCPGASSLDAGLALCGFETRPFTFIGLLPRDPVLRIKELKKFIQLNHTIVILETPYRYKKILEDIFQILGNSSKRRIFLGLHLTHPTEEIIFRGSIPELKESLSNYPKAPPIIILESGK
jgi:16S rRNA (cytidine1402-2'-O)-methyltransferase